MKKAGSVVLVFIFIAFAVGAQTGPAEAGAAGTSLQFSPFWIQVAPSLTLPIGESASYFTMGGDMSVTGEYRLPFFPLALARAGFEYGYDPILARQSVSLTSFAVGAGITYNITPFLGVKAFADGGITYGFFNRLDDFEGYFNPFVKGGVDLYWAFPPGLTVNLGAVYLYQVGLYSGIGLSAGASVGLGAPITVQKFAPARSPTPAQPRPQPLGTQPETVKLVAESDGIRIEELVLDTVFPVFFNYYDKHPVGKLTVKNTLNQTVTDLKASMFIKEYMSAPQESEAIALKSGESKTIELQALFSDSILTVTERNKVQASITLRFKSGGKDLGLTKVETVQVFDRNAMSWDDNRKAAPFVTPKDTSVLTFSKNVSSQIAGKGSTSINKNLTMAIALHEALAAYGMAYVVDPKSSYVEFAKNTSAIDYLQFPQQTLTFKAGDCDDLSILNSALLESVGIETAFITTPGHIFMAFSLALTAEEARRQFQRVDDLILRPDGAWVPVEITQISGGFMKAWEMGAKQWRESNARGLAGFFPLNQAWSEFPPVFFKGSELVVSMPSGDKVVNAFLQEQIRFIDREITPAVAQLQAEIQKTKESPQSVNKLGVLYARYGKLDNAMTTFNRILTKTEYLPALVNLSNVFYLRRNLDKALEMLNRAARKEPDNPYVLLGIARINHEEENYGAVRRSYDRLKQVNSELAGRFAYLDLRGDEATRAADVSGVKEEMVWSE